MPKPEVVALRIVVPLVVLACLVVPDDRAMAQTPVPIPLDCGPFRVNVGDLVAVNVGNPAASPADVLVRLLDREGGVLVEQRLLLEPGRSRTVRWASAGAVPPQALVRSEIVVEPGLAQPRVRGTAQVFGGRGLTYGPNFECSGEFGGRGPV
jgi:hypothetical protein